MKFIATAFKGAFILEPVRFEDDRGFFARVFCEKAFTAHGLQAHFVQCSVSYNHRKGTVRGLHYQASPHEEIKIVRCTSGSIYDVIVDLRRDSATYTKWLAVELSAENRKLLYVPKGFAHGFQTLADNSEVFYQISVDYNASSSTGLHYADHSLAITWPLPAVIVSERDRALPQFQSG